MNPPLLSISQLGLSFTSYGVRTKILHEVDLTVGQGGRVALIGETGSGKSVTTKAVLGTLPSNASIDSGTVKLGDVDVLKLPFRQREALKGTAFSLIMQDPLSSFNPVFRVGQHLDDVMRYADLRMGIRQTKKERQAQIYSVLKKVQLSDPERVYRSYPFQLSGGMRQRVLIALALLHRPQLLIADEPGTALDVTIQSEIMRLINRLVDEEQLSLLLITHNLGVVRQLADEVYVMHRGHVVEHGALNQILGSPQKSYTQELIQAIPPLYGSGVVDRTEVQAEAFVKVNALSKTFGKKRWWGQTSEHHALKRVSLDIRRGEILGLAGESGSGKTTLARLIMGLLRPTEGSVSIRGEGAEESEHKSRQLRHFVQMVYQNPGTSLNPKRSVGQTLTLPLRFAGCDRRHVKARISELLAQVDLPASYANKYPHELSGGQKQRAAIARALAANPLILVLDEPTSALDVSVQKNVIALLERLQQQLNLTFLFISHDLSLMRNFCSRVVIMLRGEVVEHGPPRQVFTNPGHPYTRALIASIPTMSEEEDRMKPVVSEEERQQFLVDVAELQKQQ